MDDSSDSSDACMQADSDQDEMQPPPDPWCGGSSLASSRPEVGNQEPGLPNLPNLPPASTMGTPRTTVEDMAVQPPNIMATPRISTASPQVTTGENFLDVCINFVGVHSYMSEF